MIDLKTLSLNDLKALVYDNIQAMETAKGNIKVINDEIRLRLQEKPPVEQPEENQETKAEDSAL